MVLSQFCVILHAQNIDSFLSSDTTIQIFNKSELKHRGFRSAYVIRHTAGWEGEHQFPGSCSCLYDDTVSIFKFDAQGTIREQTHRQVNIYSITTCSDSLGKLVSGFTLSKGRSREILPRKDEYTTSSSSYILAGDSIVVIRYMKQFEQHFDTGYVTTDTYNSDRQWIRTESTSNPKYKRELMAEHRGTFDYSFERKVDSRGRVTYYSNRKGDTYTVIEYLNGSQLTKKYNKLDNALISSDVLLFKSTGTENPAFAIVSADGAEIWTFLEKGSKLVTLRTEVIFSDFSSMIYEEIRYSKNE
jgi:hypothetical protein